MEENKIDTPQDVELDSPAETKENNLEDISDTPAEAVEDSSSNTGLCCFFICYYYVLFIMTRTDGFYTL